METQKKKRAITSLTVMSILLLFFIGTLEVGGAASVEPIPGLPEEAGIRAQYDGFVILGSSNPPSQGSKLFEQQPHSPNDSWWAYTSTYDPAYPIDYLVSENFWGVTGDICDLHWYGLSGTFEGVFLPCDPEGMIFDITFYANNASGMPGEVVCSYENVSPAITYYGDFGLMDGYYFETALTPCCSLQDGWVSIQSQGSDNNCWFLWLSSDVGDGSALQEDRIFNTTNITVYDRALTLTGKMEAPTLTPIGLVALVGLISAIAAITITRRKRR